jgi:hypothetical protein
MNNEFKGLRFSSMALPWIPVGHPRYVWRPSADCDVTRTWRIYGWKPLDEQQQPTTDSKKFTPLKVLRQL